MSYKYYAVLDFEATCDEPRQISIQEIIEFPTVLLDAETLAVIDEFESFVRPVKNPILTEFCHDLTGIEQGDVDGADTFPVVFERHQKWLRSHEGDALFVTCGNWDLRSMLPRQCRLHDLPIPSEYQDWVNIKDVFRSFKRRRPPGMKGMLKALGLRLEGRHHRGIDDCRNIARIVQELAKRGVRLQP